MNERPPIRYARAADGVHIAYQAFGLGRYDIVFVPGQITHLDLNWEYPETVRWFGSLAHLGRVIVMDRRGVGLSDRLSPIDLPPAEVQAEDIGVVIDAAGASRPILLGFAEGAQIACLFAALHPERISGIITYGMWTHNPQDERDEWQRWIDRAEERWGTEELAIEVLREVSPSHASDPLYVDFVRRLHRTALSPGAVRPLMTISIELDVRDILPAISVPSLVLHRALDSARPADHLREAATLIPGAHHVELPGEDHWISEEPQAPMFEAIGSFLESIDGGHREPTRRLATVLFTDIVGSTQRSADLGDAAWKEALETHHQIVRGALAHHGGREISTAGDGFFATFEGPAAACRCVQEIVVALREIGLQIRAGVHTGEVETIDGEIGGIGVTIGARIAALAEASELLVSSTVRDLSAGSGLMFEDAGEHELKGVPDRWHIYRVLG